MAEKTVIDHRLDLHILKQKIRDTAKGINAQNMAETLDSLVELVYSGWKLRQQVDYAIDNHLEAFDSEVLPVLMCGVEYKESTVKATIKLNLIERIIKSRVM